MIIVVSSFISGLLKGFFYCVLVVVSHLGVLTYSTLSS